MAHLSRLYTPRPRVVLPLWAALANAEQPLPAAELAARTALTVRAVRGQLCKWRRAGVVQANDNSPKGFMMTDRKAAGGPPPVLGRAGIRRRTPSAMQRLWTAMRVLKRFDDVLLSMTADVSMGTTRAYLNRLKRAGYVEQTRLRGARRGEPALIVMRRDTGSRAPRVEAAMIDGTPHRHLVDPNTGARIDISPGVVRLCASK